jgi:hypothetical protein
MDDLDALFAQAKSTPMLPSQALMARVLQDAALQQTQSAPPAAARPRLGIFAQLAAFFGGAGALAGMVSAAVAGLFIGFVQPTSLDLVTGYAAGSASTDQVELLPDVTALLTGE